MGVRVRVRVRAREMIYGAGGERGRETGPLFRTRVRMCCFKPSSGARGSPFLPSGVQNLVKTASSCFTAITAWSASKSAVCSLVQSRMPMMPD